MRMFNLFSKRQKHLRGEVPVVYTYEDMPHALRVQIIHIWHDAIGSREEYDDEDLVCNIEVVNAYEFIVKALCREYGLFFLEEEQHVGTRDYLQELTVFLLKERNYEKVLDAVEVSFRLIDRFMRNSRFKRDSDKTANDAISELNERLKEHGIGYQYANGIIIRVDSNLLHTEVVKPALQVLTSGEYSGANDEFLKAYEHYRAGRHKEAISEALKSFESVMKTICVQRRWPINENDTAKPLLDTCFTNELIPSFWQSEMSALRSLLESGVPTGRNKLGAHGQGVKRIEVPEHLVGYILHMTAASIIFLAKANDAIRS